MFVLPKYALLFTRKGSKWGKAPCQNKNNFVTNRGRWQGKKSRKLFPAGCFCGRRRGGGFVAQAARGGKVVAHIIGHGRG